MCFRACTSLLVSIAVHYKVNKFRSDAAVVDQGAALGGRAVRRDVRALLFQALQKGRSSFGYLHSCGEVPVVINAG